MEWEWLAEVPPLQTEFVFVEEAPSQQDVMWAADSACIEDLPISVCAFNSEGMSEELVVTLPWASRFTWLRTIPSSAIWQKASQTVSTGVWSDKCGEPKSGIRNQDIEEADADQLRGLRAWYNAMKSATQTSKDSNLASVLEENKRSTSDQRRGSADQVRGLRAWQNAMNSGAGAAPHTRRRVGGCEGALLSRRIAKVLGLSIMTGTSVCKVVALADLINCEGYKHGNTQ